MTLPPIAKAAEDGPGALARTTASWRAFWERSWVNCDTGAASGMTVGKAHTLQRYMQACAGRSVFPIKFNGSIFTVEPKPLGNAGNPDWRRWGDCHWWQNVRMPYHAMQAAGDFDLMMPLFDTLPDQCHGGNLMATINYMLLQHSGHKILLLPAWPKEWDVAFKLHAPRQTTVEVIYRGGKIEKLEVLPRERRKDITLPTGIEAP